MPSTIGVLGCLRPFFQNTPDKFLVFPNSYGTYREKHEEDDKLCQVGSH